MHGGTVTATSGGEGQGSAFTVLVPLARSRGTDEPVLPTPAVRMVGARRARGKRIAVVEDNADSQEMLCELLTRAGFDCHSADRGDAGLTLIREQRPDIAVVDVGLPGINGLEIARRIRSDPSLSHVYRVALTGYGQATDRLTALAAGFDEHVVKPVRAADLLRLLAVDETDAPPFRDGLMPLRRPRDTSA